MFDVNEFFRSLNTQWLGRHFWYFKELDSTNGYVKSKKKAETAHGLTCIADSQRQGRGLYGKTWETQPAANLTFTVVFKPALNNCLQTLNLMSALSVSEVLQQQTGLNFSLKWPNDVYYGNRKIGGLLTETSFTGPNLDRILLGIGLNINQREFNGELHDKACSLSLITDKDGFCREDLLAHILNQIEHNYQQWENNDQLLIRGINRKLIGYGKWVRLQVDGVHSKEPSKLLGVNSSGFLHVLNNEDELKIFTHEEVRIHHAD
ncbi:MAG: biotin--[acetyl-CoA-carboxylase] ligase [Balneolales bacterium]